MSNADSADYWRLEDALKISVRGSNPINRVLKEGDECFMVWMPAMAGWPDFYANLDNAKERALELVAGSQDSHDPTKVFVAHIWKVVYLDAAASTYRRATDLLSRHSIKKVDYDKGKKGPA